MVNYKPDFLIFSGGFDAHKDDPLAQFKLKSKETFPVLGAFRAILFLQVFLGINNVLSHLPLWNAVAHNIFGVMLFLCMIVIMYLSYRKVDAAK